MPPTFKPSTKMKSWNKKKTKMITAMVKLSFYFVVLAALTGCCCKYNDAVLVQINDLLPFVNYDKSAEYDFPMIPFNHYPVTPDFSLDAIAQRNKIPLTGNDRYLILKILDDFKSRYYPDEYDYYSYESDETIDVFFCGKISIIDGVNSFLVLLEMPDMYYEYSGSVSSILYLLNYQENRLTSIVDLSTHMAGIDTGIIIITYFIQNMVFSRIDYSFASEPMFQSIEWHIPTQEIVDYVKIKEDAKVLYFSSFIINEDGCVQLVNV